MNYHLLIIDRYEYSEQMESNKLYYELIDNQIRFIYYNLIGFITFCIMYFTLLHQYNIQQCWLIFNIWLSLHVVYLLFRFIFLVFLMIQIKQHGIEDVIENRSDQQIEFNMDLEYARLQYIKLTFQQFIRIKPIFYFQYYIFNTKLILGILIYQIFSNLVDFHKQPQSCDYSLVILVSILDVLSYLQETYIKLFRGIISFIRIIIELSFILIQLPILWIWNRIKINVQKLFLKKYQKRYKEYQQMKQDSNLCCICLLEFEQTEVIQILPCNQKHCFHIKCINQWFGVSGECPICRQKI